MSTVIYDQKCIEMHSKEIMFFMLCPLAMALASIGLYSTLKGFFVGDKQRLFLEFLIGLLITVSAFLVVMQNINQGAKVYSPENIYLSQAAKFQRFDEQYEDAIDVEGNIFSITKKMVCFENDNCMEYELLEGNEAEYIPGERVLIYKLNDKSFLRKTLLDKEAARDYANHVDLYRIYYWNFLWIGFAAFFTIIMFIDFWGYHAKTDNL